MSFARFVDKLKSSVTNPNNVLYHLMKAYHREFVRGKQSFLQRVLQEDEQVCRHFVGLVTSIETNERREHVVSISDGAYILRSTLISGDSSLQL